MLNVQNCTHALVTNLSFAILTRVTFGEFISLVQHGS